MLGARRSPGADLIPSQRSSRPLVVRVLGRGARALRARLARIPRTPVVWLDERPHQGQLAPAVDGTAWLPDTGHGPAPVPVRLPPVVAHLLTDVVVSPRASIFIQGPQVVIERPEGNARERYDQSAGPVSRHTLRRAAVHPLPRVALDRGFFLGGHGYPNYYHWLIELLPKLFFADRLPAHLSATPLLVGAAVRDTPQLAEALALVCSGRPVVYLEDDHLYEVGYLVHVNAPNAVPFNLRAGSRLRVDDTQLRPDTVARWRELMGVDGSTPSRGKRLFLARSGTRRTYNQDEVLRAFESRGFRAVRLEELSFEQQVRLVSDAELIAGPTGAAWTNLLFAAPGARAICWMPEAARDFSSYSTLATLNDVDLRYVLYPSEATTTAQMYESGYRVEPSLLMQALDELTSGSTTSDGGAAGHP